MNGFLQRVFELLQGGSNSVRKKADLTAFTDSDETALMDATTAWLKSVQDQGARDFIARETDWLADSLGGYLPPEALERRLNGVD